jgi:hypothetical protein
MMTSSKRTSRTRGNSASYPKGRRPNRPPRSDLPVLRVAELRPMHDFWGRRLPRRIPPELLRKAIYNHLTQTPNLLLESLHHLLERPVGTSELSEIKVTLFQEGDLQHIFRVSARLRAGGRVKLAMVVAKDGSRISKTARRELANLHHLHQRDPQHVVRPLSGGMLAVDPSGPPSRSGVFVYFTRWLNDLHELGVDRRLNFFINEQPFHTFSPAASDMLRSRILTLLFGYWDPKSRTAMEPPQIASGDFVVSRPEAGRPVQLCLIACRHILTSVSLARCLRLFLGYQGQWAGKVFHLLPKDPRLLFDALNQGLVVKNEGRVTWDQVESALKSYVAELQRQPLADNPEWTPLPALRRLIGSLPLMKDR